MVGDSKKGQNESKLPKGIWYSIGS